MSDRGGGSSSSSRRGAGSQRGRPRHIFSCSQLAEACRRASQAFRRQVAARRSNHLIHLTLLLLFQRHPPPPIHQDRWGLHLKLLLLFSKISQVVRGCSLRQRMGIEFENALVRKITDIYPMRSDMNGISWGKVSQSTKDFYSGEFQKVARWAPEYALAVRKEWEKKNIARYKDYTLDIRNKKRPMPSDELVAQNWARIWDSPAFKEKSKRGKLNRRRGQEDAPALPTHTAGPKTFRATKEKLSADQKRTVHLHELHEHTHTRKHQKDNWIRPRSQQVQEEFNAVTEALTQDPTIGPHFDPDEAFYNVAGGHNRRNAVYGLGSIAKSFRPGASDDITPPPPPPQVHSL